MVNDFVKVEMFQKYLGNERFYVIATLISNHKNDVIIIIFESSVVNTKKNCNKQVHESVFRFIVFSGIYLTS